MYISGPQKKYIGPDLAYMTTVVTNVWNNYYCFYGLCFTSKLDNTIQLTIVTNLN